jgi:hypothetical protein
MKTFIIVFVAILFSGCGAEKASNSDSGASAPEAGETSSQGEKTSQDQNVDVFEGRFVMECFDKRVVEITNEAGTSTRKSVMFQDDACTHKVAQAVSVISYEVLSESEGQEFLVSVTPEKGFTSKVTWKVQEDGRYSFSQNEHKDSEYLFVKQD